MSAGQLAAIWCIDAAWVAWLVIWIALSRGVKSAARHESRLRRAAHILPMNLAALLMLFSTGGLWPWLERHPLPRAPWMAYAGAVLVAGGLAFAVRARLVLAGNWSGTVTLKHGHELIRTGPYRLVRHPIYTGLLAAMLGTAIAIDRVRGLLAMALITVAFLVKIRTEEAFMRAAFGAAYDRYRNEVPALVPGMK